MEFVEISWAVTLAVRQVSFNAVLPTHAPIMLNRRDVESVPHFGARIGQDKPIDAHAWLATAGVEITGYPVANIFIEIACFV